MLNPSHKKNTQKDDILKSLWFSFDFFLDILLDLNSKQMLYVLMRARNIPNTAIFYGILSLMDKR